ncbi:hypothetical protein LPW26_18810 [Rhodopseudomonas sp. HC1]|uniref:hypothetical protein n=1 Tax=Rhodopseudomonas infernalis TaxID=2897386 RepID=UPI001EE7E176|nr:hypothetical protein [Rhodopseudomonas infernalis]MCG6206705.1 hypothetical protein [Rhodopseudomonas infernalis]
MLTAVPGGALAADDDEDEDTKASRPQVYLDFRSTYSRVPAGVLSIGFSPTSVLSQLASLAALPAPSLPASQGVGFDVPLTVDVNDRVSLYGGLSATASKAGNLDWTSVAITSWNVGIQADILQQNGGAIPTLTLQTTLTRTLPAGPLATISLNTILEATYALDADETRGFLAGMQSTLTAIDADRAEIRPNWVGWFGGFYQWDSKWKATGRAGMQSFGGAQLLNLKPLASFTQPILRFDLDKMDDDDNRLFGLTAQIAWTPKPAYQLTLRTPLYLTKK